MNWEVYKLPDRDKITYEPITDPGIEIGSYWVDSKNNTWKVVKIYEGTWKTNNKEVGLEKVSTGAFRVIKIKSLKRYFKKCEEDGK
ncbi:MAG: hypothetical protein DDT23_00990 [candidate division WS2 bacterium]|nr:hypothetical protein [Candidatus Lithacetigena glycinireducens]